MEHSLFLEGPQTPGGVLWEALRTFRDGEGGHASLERQRRITAMLLEAVKALGAALQEYPRERYPLKWASAQYHLGNALSLLGERGGDTGFIEDGHIVMSAGASDEETGPARLKQAVAAYREALKELTRERAPLDWAMTQNNLGYTYLILYEREGGGEALEQAVAAFTETLKERPRERMPARWAATQRSLGKALFKLGERQGWADKSKSCATLKAAREHFVLALGHYSQTGESKLVGAVSASIDEVDGGVKRLCP